MSNRKNSRSTVSSVDSVTFTLDEEFGFVDRELVNLGRARTSYFVGRLAASLLDADVDQNPKPARLESHEFVNERRAQDDLEPA